MNYYNEIKNELINNEIYKKVKDYSKNKYELERYYNVGKLLFNAGKHYGESVIKQYSYKLMNEVAKKYSYRTLFRIRQFYTLFSDMKVSALPTQLSWSHYTELLVLKDYDAINYYINISINKNLSYRELHNKIKSHEYERLDTNTKNKLINKKDNTINDFIKHPIIIKNKYNHKEISEKILKQLILEDIESFMNELGEGFSFIGSEYRIKLENRYNYIDILLFNIKYNCYVVVELKTTELKKEHIGQIQVYMNYIDKNIKNIYQSSTIGIIIVKYNNEFVIEYCSDNRIYNTTYELV